MTTYTEFTPSNTQIFTFQPTLDGNSYIITIPWSLFGQRYYVTCRTLGGNLVFSLPLIGSPAGINVQAATWEPNNATITAAIPHGFRVGSIINLTLSGMAPDAYNGTFACKIINGTQFTFPLNSFPGEVSTLGSVQYNINLAAGYFTASTFIYRLQNRVFEVTP
jgi:hypothetical protein